LETNKKVVKTKLTIYITKPYTARADEHGTRKKDMHQYAQLKTM
jgi:hypothetical protein